MSSEEPSLTIPDCRAVEIRASLLATGGSALARRRWRDARRFQVETQRLLAKQRVQFMEWLLLATIRDLRRETQEPVSQIAIADHAGLTRMVTSYWMILMEESGLVDRGLDDCAPTYRIILTDLGERTLDGCNQRLEAAGLTG